jgi:hypothetical protein
MANPWVGPDLLWRKDLRTLSPPSVALREQRDGQAAPAFTDVIASPPGFVTRAAASRALPSARRPSPAGRREGQQPSFPLLDSDTVPMAHLVELIIETLEHYARAPRVPSTQTTSSTPSLHIILLPLLRSLHDRIAASDHRRLMLESENGQLRAVLNEITELAHDQRLAIEQHAVDIPALRSQLVSAQAGQLCMARIHRASFPAGGHGERKKSPGGCVFAPQPRGRVSAGAA